jgi:transcriptional regulator of arginine metabolism
MTLNHVIDHLINNIIQTSDITEQNHLQERLKQEGHDVPQATLSRRLKKLNIAKVNGVYRMVKLHQPNLPVILNLQVSDHGLIVLKTHPGHASSLAYHLDQHYVNYHPDEPKYACILGTIAGDDTVLIITQGKNDVSRVLHVLKQDFPYLTIKPCD